MHKIHSAVFFAALLAGCSSPPTTNTATNARSAIDDVNTPSSRAETPANSDPQAANRTPTKAEIMQKLREKALNAPPSNVPLPKPQFKAAPENSVMSTTMNGQGAVVETRMFRNDPQIDKVEMTWKGPKDTTLKIFLKNGQNVETRADGIKDLGTTPVAVIRRLASRNTSK